MAPNSECELDAAESPPLSPIQRLLANPWLLLMFGVLLPALSYVIWSSIELRMLR